MAVFVKAKRVSDPLDDRVKARLLSSGQSQTTGFGGSISGSEHDANQPCICGLIHAFLEFDEPDASELNYKGVKSDDDGEAGEGRDFYAHAEEVLRDLLGPAARTDLCSAVNEAAERSNAMSECTPAVMTRLRSLGYDAGICKVKWESCSRLTAGSYEYIDVMVIGICHGDERYIVDLDFAAQFQLARATSEYKRLVAILPTVVVLGDEGVRQIVEIMAKAAKLSLKKRELIVPPWRKRQYMLAKWFGQYRRIVNTTPSASGAAVAGNGEIMCRAVGFGAPKPWGSMVAPATRL